ncbi:unnamed protein product [Adineta steineri]|uniref:ATP-grasp domain-containing protein n=1 Tax=Adineta steineri TaxID=433720 RepID=A0A814KD50_9BILA|nr:unnamed protein product [Adineta steineri]
MKYLGWITIDMFDAHIHILYPVSLELNVMAEDDLYIANEYPREERIKALIQLLHSNGFHVNVHHISLSNSKEILKSIDRYQSIVFNLCDGNELDGYPGASIIEEMDRLQLKYTGVRSEFYKISEDKSLMKHQLMKDGIPTMPFMIINNDTSVQDIDAHFQSYPIIVKPITSYASIDITHQSICFNAEETLAQSRRISPRALNGIFAEGYLAGREFTVLICGDSLYGIKVYPAVERIFNVKLSTYERFVTFDQDRFRIGNNSKEKTTIDPIYQYRLVSNDENDILKKVAEDAYNSLGGNGYARLVSNDENDILKKVAEDAYNSLGGNGYARVDIRTSDFDRFDPTVLEVNAQCSLSFDIDEMCSSMGHIFRLANLDIEQFTLSLIEYAQNRHY